MIIKTPVVKNPLYTFFATESSAKKEKVKTVTVSPDDGEETVGDYGDNKSTPEIPDNTEDNVDDGEETVGDYGDDTEETPDEDGNGEDVPEGETTEETPDSEETVGDYGDDTEETPDEDGNGEEQSEEQPSETTGNEVGDDTLKNYNLYKEYMELYNNINSYIDTLSSSSVSNPNGNQVINSVTNKLRDIKHIMNEYMIIKFINTGYAQNLVFFNTIIASIKLCIELLRNNDVYFKH